MPTASPNGGIGVRQNYPTFDEKEGKVITLELALNRCREANGEAPYSYVKDEMAALTAYMAFTSRGKPMDIKIPDDPRALAAYENGKEYFYTRRGQLNFSCATCHVQSPGERIRAEILAPALGIVNAMPIYRSEWSGMGTTSRRFTTCNSQIRAVPLNPQDDEYRERRILSVLCQQRPADFGPGSAAMRNHECTQIRLRRWRCLLRARCPRSPRLRGRLQDGLRRGGSRQQGGRPAAQPMDHHGERRWRRRRRRPRPAISTRRPRRAKEAEALAKASIFQATSEKTRWKDMEIR